LIWKRKYSDIAAPMMKLAIESETRLLTADIRAE
jgi:hypothetical protein